jgi:hypothetical protein
MSTEPHGNRNSEPVEYLRRWSELASDEYWLRCRYCGNGIAEEDMTTGIFMTCYGIGACGQRYWLDMEDA